MRNETENTLASAFVRRSAEATSVEWNFAPYYGIILGNEKSQSYFPAPSTPRKTTFPILCTSVFSRLVFNIQIKQVTNSFRDFPAPRSAALSARLLQGSGLPNVKCTM